jgi:hypothetical protein
MAAARNTEASKPQAPVIDEPVTDESLRDEGDVPVIDDCGINLNLAVKRSRYTLEGERIVTPSGGIVTRGRAAGKEDAVALLVHTQIPGRNEQAMDLNAAAVAVVHGAIPLDTMMLQFKRAGKLEDVLKSIARVKKVG